MNMNPPIAAPAPETLVSSKQTQDAVAGASVQPATQTFPEVAAVSTEGITAAPVGNIEAQPQISPQPSTISSTTAGEPSQPPVPAPAEDLQQSTTSAPISSAAFTQEVQPPQSSTTQSIIIAGIAPAAQELPIPNNAAEQVVSNNSQPAELPLRNAVAPSSPNDTALPRPLESFTQSSSPSPNAHNHANNAHAPTTTPQDANAGAGRNLSATIEPSLAHSSTIPSANPQPVHTDNSQTPQGLAVKASPHGEEHAIPLPTISPPHGEEHAIPLPTISQPQHPTHPNISIQTSLPVSDPAFNLTSSPRKSKRARIQTPKAKEFTLAGLGSSRRSLLQPKQYDILLTPGQAVAKNRKLPRGYKFISIAYLDADGNAPSSAIPAETGPKGKRVRTTRVSTTPTPAAPGLARRKSAGKGSARPAGFSVKDRQLFQKERNMKENSQKIALLRARLELLNDRANRTGLSKANKTPKQVAHAMATTPYSTPAPPARPGPIFTGGFVTPTNSAAMTPGGTVGTVTTAEGRRSSRAIKTPKTYLDVNEPVRLTENMRKMSHILQYMSKQKSAFYFENAVDPVALNLPTYHQIIKNPMDYTTIRQKLEVGMYSDMEDCASDIRLVYYNAKLFNPAGNVVHSVAHDYSDLFEDKYRKARDQITAKELKAQRAAEKPAPPPKQPKPKTPRASSGSGAKGPVDIMTEMQEMKAFMANIAENLAGGGNKKPVNRKPKQNLDKVPLSHEEKEKLKNDIMELPQDKLEPVLEMCTQDIPGNDAEEEEVEIDVDKLKVPTLRKLQAYVKKQQQLAKRRKNTPKRKTPTPGRGRSPAAQRVGSGRPGSSRPGSGRRYTPSQSTHMPSPPALETESPEPGPLMEAPGHKTKAGHPQPLNELMNDAMGLSDSDSDSGSDSSSDSDSAPRKKKRKLPTSDSAPGNWHH